MDRNPVSIFISSTSVDLRPEREALQVALGRMRESRFNGMEFFGSRDESAKMASLEEVAKSSVYIGVFGNRYGSGITEAEYREARRLNLRCFIYLKNDNATCDSGGEEQTNQSRLASLKEELTNVHLVSFFSNPDALAALVLADLHRFLVDESGALDRSLRTYAEGMIADPQISEWTEESYFDLQLGRNSSPFDSRMRLKAGAPPLQPDAAQRFSVTAAVELFRTLVIIGEPGAGKTTALKRLALSLSQAYLHKRTRSDDPACRIPVYVSLSVFNTISGGTPYERLMGLVRDAFERSGAPFTDTHFRALLEKVPVVVLLDGLNEIGDQAQSDMFLDGLNVFASNHPSTRFVITSRIYNFQFGKQASPVFELLELSYPQDIAAFARRYLAGETGRFMSILSENLQLRQLAVNPLLLRLTLSAFVNEQGRLPNSRGQLLDSICHGLLGRWQGTDREQEDGAERRRYWIEDKMFFLCHLAYVMQDAGLELSEDRVISTFRRAIELEPYRFSSNNAARPRAFDSPHPDMEWPRFIEELRHDRILSQTKGRKTARFWHQTLQEYFAARHIWFKIRPLFEDPGQESGVRSPGNRQLTAFFQRHVRDAHWHEVLAIVSGLADGNPAGKEKQDTAASRFIDAVWRKNRLLAALCIGNIEDTCHIPKLGQYVGHLATRLYLWGVYMRRAYPWLVLLVVVAAVTAADSLRIEHLAATIVPRAVDGSTSVPGMAWILTGVAAAIFVWVYFRVYCLAALMFERFVNDRILRPTLSALGHIPLASAQAALAEFNRVVAEDPSASEVTRQLAATRLSLPIRDEPELIYMLEDPGTRLQAMERLVEIGGELSVSALIRLTTESRLEALPYGAAVSSIVRMMKLRSADHPRRLEVQRTLLVTLESDAEYAKRLAAYRGLRELGVTDIPAPKSGFMSWPVGRTGIAAGCVLILLLVLVFLVLGGG